MLMNLCVAVRRAASGLPLLRLLALAAVLLAQTGCATTDADLDYTRQTAPDTVQDHSYHGWNNANY